MKKSKIIAEIERIALDKDKGDLVARITSKNRGCLNIAQEKSGV